MFSQIGIWIWGFGGWGGFSWPGLVTSLVDCQIHNLSTSVELSQIGIWIWGIWGGGFCWAELAPSLVDCQIHNLSTSVELSQMLKLVSGSGELGGGLLG